MKALFLAILLSVGAIFATQLSASRLFAAQLGNPGAVARLAALHGVYTNTNAIVIASQVSFGNTSNFTHYATPSFTPPSNSLLILTVVTGDKRTITSVTNSGANVMTWWKLTNLNYNTIATATNDLQVWVTQVPPGTNPPATQVWAILGVTAVGACMQVSSFVGAANYTKDWGTNAIVQFQGNVSNATANGNVTLPAAPGNQNSNTVFMVYGDDVNSASDAAAGSGMTELTEVSYNTQAAGLQTQYRLMTPSSVTVFTNITTSRDWAAVAIEIKAGTNIVVF